MKHRPYNMHEDPGQNSLANIIDTIALIGVRHKNARDESHKLHEVIAIL